ncbi:MAG: carboxyl-terminal processing protease [Paracoccaceae bacterium]|jgi:carboxyl-terminal processing protease
MKRLFSIILFSVALTGSFAQAKDNEVEGQLPLEELRLFADVFNQIRNSYVDEVNDRELLENAIRGLLEGLDPHSAYLDASSYDHLQTNTSGEFGGLGLEVSMENGFVKVISPIDDSPAQEADLRASDLIIELDDKQVKGMSLQEAVELMRGPQGTKIALTIVRKGINAPFEVTLTRRVITVRSVRSKTLEPGFGYLRVAQFQTKTAEDFMLELDKLKRKNKPLKGVIIDLRNNPGGLLQSSIQLTDIFLNEGTIVYTEGRVPSSKSVFAASATEPADTTPLVVLINGGSASASEIVAGALQDHKRALVVGTQSFGKGSVQTVLPLSKERAIKITTARYFTPNGRSIQAQGILPDIVIERARVQTLSKDTEITEADLHGHLSREDGEESNSRSRKKANGEASLAESDNQLFEALNLLKGIYLMGQRTPTAMTEAPAAKVQ